MAVNVDKEEANKVLERAHQATSTIEDEVTEKINFILKGSHKTYKYILVNGLLAKATNSQVRAISLQAGAPFDGAFDARSLCHEVLVPYERNKLHNALGGSNEPFLNKPARFTHLSTENAVRRGRDTETLLALIDVLEYPQDRQTAENYLAFCLHILDERVQELQALHSTSISYDPTLVEVYEFLMRFISRSQEGETCAIVVGALEKLLYEKYSLQHTVKAHKVNQSGASSNEIGDVDVYSVDDFEYAIEIKDKNFNSYDVQHAFDKIVGSGGHKAMFIYGPNASFDSDEIDQLCNKYEAKGLFTYMENINRYAKMMLIKIELSSKEEFLESLMNTAKEVNCKETTLSWIQELMIELGWKS